MSVGASSTVQTTKHRMPAVRAFFQFVAILCGGPPPLCRARDGRSPRHRPRQRHPNRVPRVHEVRELGEDRHSWASRRTVGGTNTSTATTRTGRSTSPSRGRSRNRSRGRGRSRSRRRSRRRMRRSNRSWSGTALDSGSAGGRPPYRFGIATCTTPTSRPPPVHRGALSSRGLGSLDLAATAGREGVCQSRFAHTCRGPPPVEFPALQVRTGDRGSQNRK